jgi:hypothetical protein
VHKAGFEAGFAEFTFAKEARKKTAIVLAFFEFDQTAWRCTVPPAVFGTPD